ncbi:MAG: hypothetical protein AB7S72_13250 [Draconibacterium sp.]
MRKLSFTLGLLFVLLQLQAQQNPHGKDFILNCADCHTSEGWEYTATPLFNHNSTNFKLEGQHNYINCRDCHTSLVFSEAKTSCADCHTDMHNTTVGMDCARCHTPKSWIVSNITQIHQQSRFPLLGAHNTADCAACHTSASQLEFQPLGIDCIDCHKKEYDATTNPNHQQTGISTNCIECHRIDAFQWSSTGFNHDFFPLNKGHKIEDCTACHKSGSFESISTECYSCHQPDFAAATNPKHNQPDFSTTCTDCHTTEPDWKPAKFEIHDAGYFPIYSGEHRGEWESCTDCHKQSENYGVFSCIDCHEHNKSDMDKEHREENGYSYNSNACFACHPRGDKEGAFNHNATAFPLKGAHTQTDCLSCHTAGYAGTSMACNSCHTTDYNEAANPVHTSAGLSTECQVCHTESGWIPSLFDHTATSGFALTGGHSGKQCAECHIGNTTSATSDCISCHQANYNEAPEHVSQKYPTNCTECHNTNNWEETTFNHNNTAFPLVGAHIATECAACHNSGYAGTPTQCNACHTTDYNEAQNPNHTTAGISTQCETCHKPTGWIPSPFNHTATTGFALTGGHSGKQCAECHIGNTTSATSDCISCHQANYNEAPEHVSQKYPTNCLECHNTNTWEETTFNHNNTAFPLVGAHIATECAACHTSGYAGTPMQCNACHTTNYNEAQNPNHTTAGISTQCETCHTPTGWIPSQFDHTATSGFALTGGHSGKQCAECHTGNTTSASSECISCHQANYNEAPNHVSQKFPTNCLQCHNTNNWEENTFNHNNTAFPLTGAHIATECAACHTSGYAGTPTLCSSCHQTAFNNTTNPNHSSLGLSTNCNDCHTTNQGWEPALFPNHQDYYALQGAHSAISTNCTLCHAGNYTSTPNTCFGCHAADYNATTDPAHSTAQFPTDCQSCHTETAWEPSTFNHDSQYFPIYSGEHRGEWSKCADCHTQPTNYSVFSCINCHEHNKTDMDDEHRGENGYVYNSINCYACHPKGDS